MQRLAMDAAMDHGKHDRTGHDHDCGHDVQADHVTSGGAREGAGRPKKLTPADASAALLTAAVYELSIGQTSVKLAMTAAGPRPEVHCYAKTARTASRMAQVIFDELLSKYCKPEEPEPKK